MIQIWGEASAANNWAKGHGQVAEAMLEPILDAIRRSAEAGDSLQGLQMWHSVGGGTGSGLGGLIAQSIKVWGWYDRYDSNMIIL